MTQNTSNHQQELGYQDRTGTTALAVPGGPRGRARQVNNRLSAMRLIAQPTGTRWFARALVVLFVLGPLVLIWLPWQQNLQASGRVIAFDPTERQQEVEAPVDGRILRWYVKEGQTVKAGDPLVSIQDPDPDLPRRLANQRQAIEDRMQAAKDRKISFTKQVAALEKSREQALMAGRNRLQMARERYKAASEALTIAELRRDLETTNFRMETELRRDRLTSELTFLTAKQRREAAEAEAKRSVNSRDAARSEVSAVEADLEKILNDAEASISSANASRQSADAELASAMRDLEDIDIRIARQACQEVKAPVDGTVYRIQANSAQGGTIVKSGERLVTITPEIKEPDERVVELYLDGNDAPQLTELWRRRLKDDPDARIRVRLQFEGWPAIQIIGWPNVAWGTFAGQVVFIDPHDDGKGKFRILVKADPDEEPWPRDFSLRQGARAQGWFLLDRVSLGYELWRRFNGFPPVVVDKDAMDDGGKKKPSKVKVPK